MLSKKELLDAQFIEARGRLIEFAAFLDRFDRHEGDSDYRLSALKSAIPILINAPQERTRLILEHLSDQSITNPLSAPFQGAFGAPQPH